jgi:hypothetical protein
MINSFLLSKLRKIEPKEHFSYYFPRARGMLEYVFGVSLTLPQLVKLRIYTMNSIEGLYKIDYIENWHEPDYVAVMQLLAEDFDLPFDYKPALKAIETEEPDAALNHWLRNYQERALTP